MSTVQSSVSPLPAPSSTPGNVSSNLSQADSISIASLEQRILNPETFLYSELVRSHLGERASCVITMLINKGRLSAPEICERIPELNLSSVKTILVSLIQLKCVQYLEETSYSGRKTVYYYFNEEGVLLMLYAGDIVKEISRYFTETQTLYAKQILQNVIALGSVTTRDFLSSIPEDASINDISHIFVRLVELQFLVPLTPVHYTPVSDLWNMLYMREYKKIPANSLQSDLKKRNEAKAKAKLEFSKLLKIDESTAVFLNDARTGLKRVNETLPLTSNLNRILKARRSRQLVQFSKARVGSISSKIYEAALRMTEQFSIELTNPLGKTGLLEDLDEKTSMEADMEIDEENIKGVAFSAIDLSRYLPANLDLRGTLTSELKISKRKKNQGHPEKRIKTEDGFVVPPALPILHEETEENIKVMDQMDEDFEDDDGGDDDGDDNPHSISLINGHLKLLQTSTIPFIQESKPGMFFIPYSKIIPLLRSAVYDSIVASTLGPPSHRVLRCIRSNNLCTERTITTTSLMKEKDIRAVISTLVKYNAVEIQEVPRTADRAASRAVFLFRVNDPHAFNTLKQNLAWNIARMISKIEAIKEDNFTLLKKAERDDVKGKEMELLLPSEINQLKLINERESNGLVRIYRLLSLWEVFKLF